MPPSPSKPTIQSVNEKVDLIEGSLTNAIGTKVNREEVEILINEGLQKMKAELAEKMSRGDVDYAMRESIDDQAAPRSLVEETRNNHNEMRGELARIERGLSEAILEAQATVTQFRMNIDDRLTRVVDTGNASQGKIRSDLDALVTTTVASQDHLSMKIDDLRERVVAAGTIQEQHKESVDEVMVRLAVHEAKMQETELENEHEKQRQEAAAAEAELRREEMAEDKGTRTPETRTGKEEEEEEEEEEEDEEEKTEKKPSVHESGGDPLQFTGWRPAEEFDISSPVRGRDWNMGHGGKGDGGKGSPQRGNLYEQKGFDKRCQKFSNEKVGLSGEQDFKNYVFDIRKISEHVPHFDKFLEWLCEEQDEVTDDILTKKLQETKWDIGYFNHQLYGVLRETCIGSAKNSVMSYEEDTTINGARLLQEFAREHLHGSKVGLAALGQRGRQ